jgi:hypothetical protein
MIGEMSSVSVASWECKDRATTRGCCSYPMSSGLILIIKLALLSSHDRRPACPSRYISGGPPAPGVTDYIVHRHSGARKSSRSLFSLSSYTVWLITEIHLVRMFLKGAVDILYDVCPGMYIVRWRSPPPLHMVVKAGSETMSIRDCRHSTVWSSEWRELLPRLRRISCVFSGKC